MKPTRLNPFRLLNSVPFGIVLMALTGAYIAAGSARPWFKAMGLDDYPLLRNWFDKTDMQFFNAWPLKTLMLLLVANLVVVTWKRIPLTPPRYGVWCIHAGIITLICGTSLYYRMKVEGRVRIYTDPALGPTTVDHFYDKDQRSLFVRIGQEDPIEIPMPSLPRFKEYDERFGNVDSLVSRGLTGIEPGLDVTDHDSTDTHKENLAELIGCKGQKLKVDVVGFYPYGRITTDFTTDPTATASGVDVLMQSVADSQPVGEDWWLVGSEPQHNVDTDRALMDLQHVDADASMAAVLSDSASKLFHLDVNLPNQPPIPLDVQVGKTYPLANTGYALLIKSFVPNFPTFDTGEPVSLLEVMVTSPRATFRRFVMQGKDSQTDFKIGAKMREQKPIDPDLKIAFHVHDPFRLLPEQNTIKHTFLTPAGSTQLIDIFAGTGTNPSGVTLCPTGIEDIPISLQSEAPFAPFAGAAANPPADDPASHPPVKIHVERHDHIRPVYGVYVVPPAQRDKDAEDVGYYQIAKLKVSMGDWSQIVYAPYADSAADHLRQDVWRNGFVLPPGAIAPLQFQLGNTTRPLPVRLSLDQFKLIPYPGASVDTPNAMMLDFISTVTLANPDTGDSYTDVAKMNHPIYYNGGKWLFFQAAYDSSGGHEWTQLGVGNRPFVGLMITGCVMIFIGLAYAFYAKPMIIRKMKQNAIAKAIAAGKMQLKPELITS